MLSNQISYFSFSPAFLCWSVIKIKMLLFRSDPEIVLTECDRKKEGCSETEEHIKRVLQRLFIEDEEGPDKL